MFGAVLAFAPASARAQAAPRCALTTDATQPATATPGHACWTDVEPYPFGDDGGPVDTSVTRCKPHPPADDSSASCYLRVTSMAFRAYNRGLAATKSKSGATAYGVWLFNGKRWYPDPTFPGSATCPGDTVIWAGKLDYWLVGPSWENAAAGGTWPRICRYDGSTFTWQPLDVPSATKNHFRKTLSNSLTSAAGALRTGTCFAWDNCWFFGDYGATVRWDGNALTDASPSLDLAPQLGAAFTAAASGSNSSGVFGLAVTAAFGGPDGSPIDSVTQRGDSRRPGRLTRPAEVATPASGEEAPAPPDEDEPAPQAYTSRGRQFSPVSYAPPSVARPDDPQRTDLIALAFDSSGRGWSAGIPTGWRFTNSDQTLPPTSNRDPGQEPSPLLAISPRSGSRGCPGPATDRFTMSPPAGNGGPTGTAAYLWTSLSVFPGSGDALAGGLLRPADGAGNDFEPLLVRASCSGTVAETRFRVPDPTWTGAGPAPLAPADPKGRVASVAANAENEAWAATTGGQLSGPDGQGGLTTYDQRPHVYHWTDGATPTAPAGDDVESRPQVVVEDPPIIVEEPPPAEPEPLPAPPPVVQPTPPAATPKPLPAAVYAVHSAKQLRKTKDGKFILYLTFRVRRPVTIGVEALRRGKVVARSGLHHFSGTHGRLALKLDRKHWPTKIRWVQPKAQSSELSPISLAGSSRP